MKAKIAHLSISLAATCVSFWVASAAPIFDGQAIYAPNKRFKAMLDSAYIPAAEGSPLLKETTRLQIQDLVTKQRFNVPVMLPLFSMYWAGDSHTIVAVSHLAGGSCASVIHFDGSEWKNYPVDPVGDNIDSYVVTALKLGKRNAVIMHVVRVVNKGKDEAKYYRVDSRVDYSSGSVTQPAAWKATDENAYPTERKLENPPCEVLTE